MLAPKYETGIGGGGRLIISATGVGIDGHLMRLYYTGWSWVWLVPDPCLLRVPYIVGCIVRLGGGGGFTYILPVHMCEVLVLGKAEMGEGIKNSGCGNIGLREAWSQLALTVNSDMWVVKLIFRAVALKTWAGDGRSTWLQALALKGVVCAVSPLCTCAALEGETLSAQALWGAITKCEVL